MRWSATIPFLAMMMTACDASGSGDDAADDSTGGASDCAPADDPAELEIGGVQPAPGTTAVNADIAHSFTIVDSPGVFTSLTLLLLPTHTAGTLDPPTVSFTINPMGDNLVYTLPAVKWMATGHVEIGFDGTFVDDDGCHHTFPSPVFSYDLE